MHIPTVHGDSSGVTALANATATIINNMNKYETRIQSHNNNERRVVDVLRITVNVSLPSPLSFRAFNFFEPICGNRIINIEKNL